MADQRIDDRIKGTHYLTVDGVPHVVCLLELTDGYTVTGDARWEHDHSGDKASARLMAFNQARRKARALVEYADYQSFFSTGAKNQ